MQDPSAKIAARGNLPQSRFISCPQTAITLGHPAMREIDPAV
jgi:hypothetical protein